MKLADWSVNLWTREHVPLATKMACTLTPRSQLTDPTVPCCSRLFRPAYSQPQWLIEKAVLLNLLDRFEGDREAGAEALATDIADLLGSRRLYSERRMGVLAYGLPPLLNRVARSADDRQYVAGCIADALERFQPHLENVRVTPVESAADFSFVIEATVVDESSTVTFRILSPHVGGGLGAQVEVVSLRDDY